MAGSLQKCLHPLDTVAVRRYPSGLDGEGKRWRIGMEVYGDRDILPRDAISRKLSVPNAERIFFIRHALRANPALVTRIPTGIPSHSPRLPRNAATGQHPRNSSTATRLRPILSNRTRNLGHNLLEVVLILGRSPKVGAATPTLG